MAQHHEEQETATQAAHVAHGPIVTFDSSLAI